MKSKLAIVVCLSTLLLGSGVSAGPGERNRGCSGNLATLDEYLGVRSVAGNMVVGVQPSSAAESMGFGIVDLVVGFNGRRMRDYPSPDAFMGDLREAAMLSRARIDLLQFDRVTRSHRTHEVEMRIPAVVGSRMGFSSVFAILVTEVRPGGPAARSGIRRGDFITVVDGEQVASIGDVRSVAGRLHRSAARDGYATVKVAQWEPAAAGEGHAFRGRQRTISVHLADH